jgi:toxin ParE1/3/4
MRGIVRRRDRARQDLIDVYRYLAREAGVRTSSRFFAQAEATFERLARMPRLGPRYEAENPAFAETRYFPISRFKKYLVFYLPTTRGVDIVRVLHGARDIHGILAEEFGIEPEEQ